MKGRSLFGLLILISTACADDSTPLFELLPSAATGIDFVNELPENPEVNIINYLYYYNGAGVAAGDVDAKGRKDRH